MTIALEASLVAHMFYYTVLFYIMSRSALYIPIAQARGFTAHFGKTNWAPVEENILNHGKRLSLLFAILFFVVLQAGGWHA